ncbi:MAG TPA: FHA domain-containing protein [Solirubrobacteraceae bacterium]|nr:FHA domain-containing protein [Solirubrobacteraceae bacterium]
MKALPPMLRTVSPAELAERVHFERRGVPFVVYLDGDGRQQLVDLGERSQALSVGRGEANDVPLPWDSEVSRVHAMLEPVGAEWTLVDDGLSRNGSFVNGERVRARRRLADGDLIGIGRTLLVFAAAAAPDAAPTDTARDSVPPDLSPAQRRVLAALCRPAVEHPFAGPPSNREIAEALVVSVDTVKSHLHALFELFGVQDMPQNRKRAELVRRAFERGLAGG